MLAYCCLPPCISSCAACNFRAVSNRDAVAGFHSMFSSCWRESSGFRLVGCRKSFGCNGFYFLSFESFHRTHSCCISLNLVACILRQFVLFSLSPCFFAAHILNRVYHAKSIIDVYIFRIYLFINFVCMRMY